MLRKYIALYKYYCKVAPAVWRSRGQQCTGECKYPFLSCGISVMLGSGRNRAFPGHMREGMRKPRERDPTPAMPLCTPRLLYPRIKSRISCLRFPLRPVNLWDTIKSGYMVSFFSRNPGTEFEIFGGIYSSKRCKSLWSATGPTCHTALCSTEIPGGRSGPSVLKKDLWERRKGSQCQISPFFSHLSGAFVLLPWLQIWFLQMPFSVQLPFIPSHIPASCSEPPPDSSISLNKTCISFSPGQLSISSVFNMILLCNFKSGDTFWPFPFFLLARIQEYYLSCDVLSSAIFKSFRLPVQSTKIFIQFSSPHIFIIRTCNFFSHQFSSDLTEMQNFQLKIPTFVLIQNRINGSNFKNTSSETLIFEVSHN